MNPLKTDIEALSTRVGNMIAGVGISVATRMELQELQADLNALDTTKDIEAFKAGTQAGIDHLHATIEDLKAQIARSEGPGSPTVRFQLIMDELRKRFPEVSPFSGPPHEIEFMKCIDQLLAKANVQ